MIKEENKMDDKKTNKMANTPMKSLFWKMGLPMIISMVLQALYNVVDSIFVTVLQSLGYAIRPLIISLLRLIVFVFPVAYVLTKSSNVTNIVWWTFPIAEILTAIFSAFILKK